MMSAWLRTVLVVSQLCALSDGLAVTNTLVNKERSLRNTDGNLCIDGRLAPELVLLGAAKASTSVFAKNVHLSSGIVYPKCLQDEIAERRRSFCPPDGLKEMHVFNHPERVALGKDDWLRHYPECDATSGRAVATDMTPVYLQSRDAPKHMIKFYGDKISAVTFMVFLREPVSCVQSYFYFEHYDKRTTFQRWTDKLLKAEGGTDRHFWNAIYPDNLQRYFSKFDPSQFIIVPMRYNVLGGKDGNPEVTDFVWEKFGLPRPSTDAEKKDSWNGMPHPTLEQDLAPNTLAQLRTLAANLSSAPMVAKVLVDAAAEGKGPFLYGYKGSPTDVDQVAAWLEDGW